MRLSFHLLAASLGAALTLHVGCAGCSAPPVSTNLDGLDTEDAGTDAGTVCAETPMGEGQIIASGLNAPRRLLEDGDAILISEAGSLSLPNGRLLRVAKTGGTPDVIASGFTAPDAIAADLLAYYVVDATGLWQVLRSNGSKKLINSTQNNAVFGDTDIHLTLLHVVFSTGRRWLVRVQKDGDKPELLFQAPAGAAIRGNAIVGNQVYFLVAGTSEAGLYQGAVDGNPDPQRLRMDPLNGHSLHVLPNHFLWTEGSGGLGMVQVAPRSGGPAVAVASALEGPAHAAVVGGNVYFKDKTSGTPADQFFWRVGCDGNSLPVGALGVGPGDVLYDGQSLFFSSQESGGKGYVARLP